MMGKCAADTEQCEIPVAATFSSKKCRRSSRRVEGIICREQPVRRSPRLLELKARARCLTPVSSKPTPKRCRQQKLDLPVTASVKFDFSELSQEEVDDVRSVPNLHEHNARVPSTSTANSIHPATAKYSPEDSIDLAKATTPLSSPELFLFGGLPDAARQLYAEKRKIKDFYDWQKACLSDERLLSGSNMVISLPTGAGKTLVAEILMLREALVHQRSSLLILPYVAIVQEKIQALSVFDEAFGIWVEEYAASKGRLPPIKRRKNSSVYVATIEKANMLINSLIETDRIDELGLVIIDELHMLGDGSRGAIMEQALVKFMNRGNGQIVGITATLANVEEIAQFLHAAVYSTNFRPVKLVERVKIGNTLYLVDSGGKLIPECDLAENKLGNRDPDGLVPLLQDIIPQKSVIIFCPTKLGCENVCKMIARIAPRSLRERHADERRALVTALREDEDGRLYSGLDIGIMAGVAFHHSGLTFDERKAVETAFQDGIVSILCSTSTLAAGVNLPARRVIIKTPLVGREPLSKAQYTQMVGRAGRAGYDEKGDAVTIVHPGPEEKKFREMLSSPLKACQSALGSHESLSSFLLDLISLKIADKHEDFVKILATTLLGMQDENAFALVEQCLLRLCNEKIITLSMDEVYYVTTLGSAAFTANMSPLEVQAVNESLIENLCKGIVLSSHFHLIFTVVPMDVYVDVDWNVFYNEYRAMPKGEQELLASMGLSEKQLVMRFVDRPKLKQGDSALRLYVAFIMQRIWRQESLWSIGETFNVTRGWLQSTLQSVCSQASSIARFSEKIPSLWPLKQLLPDLVQKLRECKEKELIPLLAIDGVKRNRARQLYEKGYKTVGSLANANPDNLVASIENLNRRQASTIIHSAQAIIRDQLAEKLEEMEIIGASTSEFISALTDAL